MSAAAIAAMALAVQKEERQRRMNDPDYEPLCSVGALVDNPWAGWAIVIFLLAWSVGVFWMSTQ